MVISLDHSIGVKRSNKGLEIYKKLRGLENFLKDFSILESRTKDEIKVWDYYLIYSIIFEQNEKIIDDFSNFFNDSEYVKIKKIK